MSKKLKCWRGKITGKFGNIWDRKGGGWVYLYKKGMFRDKEDSFVISTSLTGGSNPEDRDNQPFETKSQALKFAKSFMRKNNKC